MSIVNQRHHLPRLSARERPRRHPQPRHHPAAGRSGSNAAAEAVAHNIKGALAIPHPYGRLQFGADLELHFRTLIGAGCNPNVAAVVVIGIEDGWTQKVVDGIKEKFYGESYRRVSDLVHRRGKKLLWHSCGNIYPFLERFVDWGIDGLVTLEPTAGMDLGKVRAHVGHKLALVGNLDVSHLLVSGTREEIEEAVKQAIRGAAQGRGYVLSAAHSHPHIDATRLRWMVEAARQGGRYPIRI